MRYRRPKFRTVALIVALLTVAAAGTAVAAPINLKRLQAQWLDPQADTGENNTAAGKPGPSDPRSHAGMSHTAMSKSTTANPALAADFAPADGGQWEYLKPFPATFDPPHMVMGKGGKILMVHRPGKNGTATSLRSILWDPSTDVRREIPTPTNLFCAGHVLMPDGRALIVGGTISYTPFKGAKTSYAFNFETEKYEVLPSMLKGRWYPSVVTMPDGREVIASGLDETGVKTNIHEVFDPATNTMSTLPGKRSFTIYPRFHVAANGKVFYANSKTPGFWDPFTNIFQRVGGTAETRTNAMASCFVGDVRDQNLIVMGGGWPATNTTRIIDLDAATPTFQPGPALPVAKGYLSCVNLSDGTLFEANGGSDNSIAGASTEASILKSISDTFTPVNPLPAGEHRVYHSMLALLDDGRVLSMTSNPKGQGRSTSVLAYSPAYLLKGERPVFTSAPTVVSYGGTYPVAATSGSAAITHIIVTTPPAPTHGQDSSQRSLTLPIVNDQITMPTQNTIMPPGMYRMWAVDTLGRPSNAKWFQIQ